MAEGDVARLLLDFIFKKSAEKQAEDTVVTGSPKKERLAEMLTVRRKIKKFPKGLTAGFEDATAEGEEGRGFKGEWPKGYRRPSKEKP